MDNHTALVVTGLALRAVHVLLGGIRELVAALVAVPVASWLHRAWQPLRHNKEAPEVFAQAGTPSLLATAGNAGNRPAASARIVIGGLGLNLPPQQVGPWRPAGHGPDVPSSDVCVCGESGVVDWAAHIAKAATREGKGRRLRNGAGIE